MKRRTFGGQAQLHLLNVAFVGKIRPDAQEFEPRFLRYIQARQNLPFRLIVMFAICDCSMLPIMRFD